MSENEPCKLMSGEITMSDSLAKQCLERSVSKFVSGEIDIHDFMNTGNPVTEYEGPRMHNACVSCKSCDRTFDIAATSRSNGRIAVASISKDARSIAKRIFGR